ncbi:MAG: cell wall hydrolase [Lachnospiraceae bacterium]
MNRMKSSRFPSKLREVVYQNHQFAPARDGALTRALKKPSLVSADCKRQQQSHEPSAEL